VKTIPCIHYGGDRLAADNDALRYLIACSRRQRSRASLALRLVLRRVHVQSVAQTHANAGKSQCGGSLIVAKPIEWD
jgi:hypothetical protein